MHTRSRPATLSAVAWTAAALFACGPAPAQMVPPVPSGPPNPGLAPFAYITPDGVVDTADAGTVAVPENRARPGRSVTLAYVRLRARTARPGPPLVYLAGGPGGAASTDARGNLLRLFEDLRGVGDVILLDQRGTGRSLPALLCPGRWDLPADRPLADPAVAAAFRSRAAACAARLRRAGVDPAAYNTVENADDVEALRQALGVPRVSLFGFSYGSRLALEVARRHPGSVARVVLGGVEGAGQTYKLPAHTHAAFARLDSAVRADPRLRREIPDLLGLMDRVHARLRQRPATVRIPIRTILRYDERGWWRRRGIDLIALFRPSYPVLLGEPELQALLAVAAGRDDVLRELPAVYHAMDRGDFRRAAMFSLLLRRGQEVGTAMGWVTDCTDGVSPGRADSIARQAAQSIVGARANWPFPDVCAGWGPLADPGEAHRSPVTVRVPVLAVAGTLDGRTPVEQAREVVRALPDARLVVVENAAHDDDGIFLFAPVRQAVLRFLTGEAVEGMRVARPPLEFAPPVPYRASVVDTLFVLAMRDGGAAAVARYRELLRAHAGDYVWELTEAAVNRLGYRLLRAGRAGDAVEVFQLNVELYPHSLNVYDSLGEGYLALGDRPRAIENLRRATSMGYNPHSYVLLWRAERREPPTVR